MASVLQLDLPAGVVLPFAGSTAPDGWLLCDGTTKNRVAFARLFAAIGTTFNTGGELVTEFRLPNTQGVFIRGAGSQSITDGTTKTYSATHGTRQGDKTSKNGLTATAANSSVSGSVTASSSSVSGSIGGSDGSHSHNYTVRDSVTGVAQKGLVSGNASWPNDNIRNLAEFDNGSHGHGFSLTAAAQSISHSLTAAAQSITIGAGDAETRPANVGMNHIIKI
jgi:microcystin-dependent protein